MADPVTWALIIGGTMAATQGGMSFMQAKEQEEYAGDVHDAQTRAARTQATQIYRSAQLEKEKTLARHHLIESRIRVAAGESGIGLGGTYEALERQADYDASRNVDIIMENAAMGARAAMSQVPVKAPSINPLVAGFMGALQGGMSGLSIVSSVSGMGGKAAPPAKTQAAYSTGTV